jgi:hypothetical protein
MRTLSTSLLAAPHGGGGLGMTLMITVMAAVVGAGYWVVRRRERSRADRTSESEAWPPPKGEREERS